MAAEFVSLKGADWQDSNFVKDVRPVHELFATQAATGRRKLGVIALFLSLVFWWALTWAPMRAEAQPNPALLGSLSRVQTPRLERNQDPVERLLAQVEASRLLLSELRKPIPVERRAADEYLRHLRDLAAIADPVNLSLLASNVINQAPYYFDWAEREYDDPDQRALDYYVGGARGFFLALEEFKRGVLLVVMNQLEALMDLIYEYREQGE